MSTGFASLYIHFPFCETKCHYCDFYSIGRERTTEVERTLFVESLTRECESVAGDLAPTLDTIFFGGGTPSMTDPNLMATALRPLGLAKRVNAQTEWTMEANPSSVSQERLEAFRAIGVNRLSFGVQAMRDDLLLRLGRVHDSERAIGALKEARAAGFTNISCDLLCGVPGQTLEDLRVAIHKLLDQHIQHLSIYLLTLAPHHPMASSLPEESEQLSHLALIHEEMVRAGFRHYEISNFARPGREARHNLNYWKRKNYLGLGPSAHSFDAKQERRWKNVSSLRKYGELLRNGDLPREQFESLTPVQTRLEEWMLAARLDEGFPKSWIRMDQQRAAIRQFETIGWIEEHPEDSARYRVSAAGFPVSEEIISKLSTEN